MGLFFGFIAAIYIAIRILKEESGNGDFYRSVGMTKRANDSDTAVGCATTFLIFVGIIVVMALLGVGS